MAYRDRFQTFALLSLLALPLGTVACSQGSSPTEPAFDLDSASADSNFTSASDESRGGRGGNQNETADRQNRRGRRNDDTAADRRGRGNDDGTDDRRGRRGNGDQADDRQPRAPRAGQEFTGAVAAVGATSLTLANGVTITVDAATAWSRRGDLFSLADLAASLAAGQNPRVEGRAARQTDGTLLAHSIKAEFDGDDD